MYMPVFSRCTCSCFHDVYSRVFMMYKQGFSRSTCRCFHNLHADVFTIYMQVFSRSACKCFHGLHAGVSTIYMQVFSSRPKIWRNKFFHHFHLPSCLPDTFDIFYLSRQTDQPFKNRFSCNILKIFTPIFTQVSLASFKFFIIFHNSH